MKIEQLEQLVAIHRYGTVSEAADVLYMSQPAVSRSIQALEAEVGQPLLERSHNRVHLNEAGLLALSHAQRILDDVQAMRDSLDDHARTSRTVRVLSCAPAPVWELTRRIVFAFPGTILSTSLSEDSEVERSLLSGATDLAVIRRMLPPGEAMTRILMHEELSVLIPPTHWLSQRNSLAWEDINGEHFLIQEAIGFWGELVRRRLPESEFSTQSDPMVFQQLVATSQLLSFVTNVSSTEDLPQGYRAIPIDEADARVIYYVAIRSDASDQVRSIFSMF